MTSPIRAGCGRCWRCRCCALLEWRAARRARARARAAGRRRAPTTRCSRSGGRASERRSARRCGSRRSRCWCSAPRGPEWGREVVRRGATGSDVVLVIDVSASMDARDVPPSRLDEARREALARARPPGRAAASAWSRSPATRCGCARSRSTAPRRGWCSSRCRRGTVSEPGTDLGRGCARRSRCCRRAGARSRRSCCGPTARTSSGRRAQPIDDVARAGVRVFAVGVGTPAGDVVPVLDADGRATDVKRDERGDAVRSRLDEALLRTLAARTRGAYFSASRPGGELPRLLGALGELARAGRRAAPGRAPGVALPAGSRPLAALLLLLELRARAPARAVARDSRAVALRAAARAPPRSSRGVARCWSPSPRTRRALGARRPRVQRGATPRPSRSTRGGSKRGGPDAVRVNRATARGARRATQPQVARAQASCSAGRHDRAGRTARATTSARCSASAASTTAALAVAAPRARARSRATPTRAGTTRCCCAGGQSAAAIAAAKPQPQPGRSRRRARASRRRSRSRPQTRRPRRRRTRARAAPDAGGTSMTREQAEQLLNALQELARAEQQRQRKVRAVHEKRGKDW